MFAARSAQADRDITQNTLPGFRVLLRAPVMSDYPQWLVVRSANRKHLEPFEPTWDEHCLTEDFFERRLRRVYRNWREDTGRSFLILSKADNRLIGGVNINNICRGAAQFASLGYWLDKDHEAQGYMAESLRLVIAHSFEALKLQRLNASCLPENERSKKLILRCGFTEEGFAKKYLQINGRWQDHVLYGLPRDDWEKSRINQRI